MESHRKTVALIFGTLAWFAVIAQFVLMLDNRVVPLGETIVRFFSFFTILTNMLVAVFFTWQAVGDRKFKAGTLTAIATYIAVVGLVYQVVLRQLWEPTGLQQLVDELLHSVIPLLVIGYWFWYEHRQDISYKQITNWLIFPFVYLVYMLIRGHFSGFYPYPFINVSELGFFKVMLHAFGLLVLFAFVSVAFVAIGRRLKPID